MPSREFPYGSVSLPQYALDMITNASRRLAEGGTGLSTHEYSAAALVNGRLDQLEGDFRLALITMGPDWAHAVVEVIYDLWRREMKLPADHPDAPLHEQKLFPNR